MNFTVYCVNHTRGNLQLVDDLLDFTSCEAMMGKPTTADLRLGLATAPVLFAAQEYPDLNPLIMRRFRKPGDVELARKCVEKVRSKHYLKFIFKFELVYKKTRTQFEYRLLIGRRRRSRGQGWVEVGGGGVEVCGFP